MVSEFELVGHDGHQCRCQ